MPKKQFSLNAQYVLDRITVNAVTGCWEWLKARTKQGYGVFCLAETDRKPVYAHRYMFKLHNPNSYDPGLHILHACDHPRCCNPKHLFQGTRSANAIDMFSKKRSNRTSITPDIVLQIRASPAHTSILAARYNVSKAVIRFIRSGRTWAWVTDQVAA